MAIATNYDLDEVSLGDDVGTDATFTCCDETMTVADPDKYGDRTHTCGSCGTCADVTGLGLLGDIRD
ncbi:hypothetical protein EST92_11730 [Streptomyces sp. TM32]|uniref:hypothetical protein n=1 Tax=Streptomyces sp. TM32 TaxID=1652669 RepID=UPI0010110C82|nr:hypothetical protein [Streptomyces sp. TM32]RXS84221.1 hypothetical protein EST92_11730 [Streptomyces sp. TM32]